MYYYGARYYDPVLGRFISPDPWEGDLSSPQTLNKYSYVLNNPIKFVDPTGMYKMETGEVEDGDTFTGIAKELNSNFGTSYNVADYAKFNNISGGIKTGDKVLMGAYNNDGSMWKRAYDAAKVTLNYWNSLNEIQQKITHFGRNLFQADLPKTWSAMVKNNIDLLTTTGERGWKRIGQSPTHNLGETTGNIDVRGLGQKKGMQAIYDTDGDLVTTPENMGTYDFGIPGTYAHNNMDVAPWVRWGNSPADTTSQNERKNAYDTFILNFRF